MPKYLIPVVFKMWGNMEIEAPSLMKAEEIALTSEPLPTEKHYVDDSIILDRDAPDYGMVMDSEQIIVKLECQKCGKQFLAKYTTEGVNPLDDDCRCDDLDYGYPNYAEYAPKRSHYFPMAGYPTYFEWKKFFQWKEDLKLKVVDEEC